MKKNGNHETPAVKASACTVSEEGRFRWAFLAIIGEMTPEGREGFRRQQVSCPTCESVAYLPVDTCPFCDSPFVAHIDSPKGRRHICAECFDTWEECYFVTPPAEELEGFQHSTEK
ncbi:MAG: hypothetical protein ABIH46_04085 [Chloroflexota bacterium]